MQRIFFFAIKEAKDRPKDKSYLTYAGLIVPGSLSVKKERPKGRFGIMTLITDAEHAFLNDSEREDLLLLKVFTVTFLTINTPSWDNSKNSVCNQ